MLGSASTQRIGRRWFGEAHHRELRPSQRNEKGHGKHHGEGHGWSSLQPFPGSPWRSDITVLILTCLFMISCSEERLASAKWEWNESPWIHGDKKTLTMTAPDTTTLYRMDLKVNHEESFPFANLYVRTTTTYPSGKEVVSVTSLELVNPDGTWAGDPGENCCKLKLPLQSRFTFPEPGEYTWTVEPWMRIDSVPGLRSLEVICSPVKE